MQPNKKIIISIEHQMERSCNSRPQFYISCENLTNRISERPDNLCMPVKSHHNKRRTGRSLPFKDTLSESIVMELMMQKRRVHIDAPAQPRCCFEMKFSSCGAESTTMIGAIHPIISPGCMSNESTLSSERCV